MSVIYSIRKMDPGKVSGLREFEKYPTDFQAAAFPTYATDVRITGNDQAFFFARNIKDGDPARIVDIVEDTTKLRELFINIIAQGATAFNRPFVRMQIDADLFEDVEKFVEKYYRLDTPKDIEEKKRLLRKEAEIIRSFVNNGGMLTLAREVLQEYAQKNDQLLPEMLLNKRAEEFLERNFRLEGVVTENPLPCATWELKTTIEGTLKAYQSYTENTEARGRPWCIGTEPELALLVKSRKRQIKRLAQNVRDAVAYTAGLRTILLTYGYTKPKAPEGKPVVNGPRRDGPV